MPKNKLTLCKRHHEDFITWSEAYKFDIQISKISECYYCNRAKEFAVTSDSIGLPMSELTNDECASGVCPIR